ncbi:N-acylneuraminate cytidylyltransferase [Algoriphagus boseongensis]|uniref:N-acylneuraminate cytidylyltransferase n=1 Tax=Algoriphagus boseongensis TaxID=1442587 RepID=A0A4R6TBK2_9BACT|nr:acylneuraminate cytidylyltransferase family protein [Algoriphagus boseongensis]TDQ19623.1 N-acylneuraminate cytidylyltransferase [Algoriphagus boseongensis]
MRILGLIPARGGSKGIPGKNIKHLAGKPLLAYTYESAKESDLLTKTILSSDDLAIIQEAKRLGMEVPFIRPSDLAEDSSPTLPVIVHALNYFSAIGEFFDAVCLLQVTNPFRRKGFIDEAIKKFKETNADALVSVLPVPHEFNPHWVFEPNANGMLSIATGEKKIISRRQDLPPSYFRDGAIYLTKTEVILKQNSLYGASLAYLIGDQERYVNLDTMQDWVKAEQLVKTLF